MIMFPVRTLFPCIVCRVCVCVSEHVLLIAVPRLQDTPGGGGRGPRGPDMGFYVPSGGRERWGDSHA